MGEPDDQAYKSRSRLTANGPNPRGRIIAVKELKRRTRLIRGTLLDDRLRKSLVAIDENLQKHCVNSDLSLMSLLGRTYRLPFTKGDTNHITIFLGPLGDHLDVALFHLEKSIR